ncbi:MAG: T9SS type A sorting domain-containing protein [Bacteroidales bacterium]|nr:T9SS type A sorting domain-containing protein [Bacteroidales bacterium]
MKAYRKWLLVAVAAILSFAAQSQDLEKLYETRPEIYFELSLQSLNQLKELNEMISIDGVDGLTITAYANRNQYKKLLNAGFQPTLMAPPSLLEEVEMIAEIAKREVYEWDAYPTYSAYVAMMNGFETDYPAYCETFNFGTLNSGRELLMLRINNGSPGGKPKFLYTSSMHGDETAGYVLMLRLADYLLSNYGIDERVTNIVDKLDIYINPLANPDGTFYSGNNTVNGSTRGNANGIDLNRNYPDPEDGPHPDGNAYQSETVAFMNLAVEHQFIMSANFHGGAEVVNYPYDTWSRRHADDAWWIMVSREYADSAQYFSPAGYMTDLNNGITNGYDWYSVSGGRQDYMNYFENCREFILEISDIKTLPANKLPAWWTYNKASLLSYMEQATYGISGVITNELTGEPIEAQISIEGHDLDNSFVVSALPAGNYHRPIKAGSYSLTYSAEGYYPQTINLGVDDYESITQDVQLMPGILIADFTASAYQIPKGETIDFTNVSYGQNIVSYEWTFEGGTPSTSSDENPQNIKYNETGIFDVQLKITNADGDTSLVLKENLIEVNLVLLMQNGTFEMCEALFYDSGGPDADYGNMQDLVMTIKPDTEEALVTVNFNSFSIEANAGCNYDWLKIYDGINTNAPLLGSWCGTNAPDEIIASNDAGALTFQFHSDQSVTRPGWEAVVSCTSTVNLSEIEAASVKIWPNPTVERQLHVQADSKILSIELVDAAGNLVYKTSPNEKTTLLSLNALSSGMYFLKIQTIKAVELRKLMLQ